MFDFDDLSAPALSMSDVAPPPEDAGSDADPSWRCWSCDNDTFTWTGEGWKCARCRSSDYYNIVQSQKHETDHGIWMYVPRQSQASSPTSSPPPLLPDPSQATLLVDRASRVLNRPRHGPPVPPQEHEGREQAESEPLTDDPIIELEGMVGKSRSSRRSRRRRAQQNKAVEAPANVVDTGTGVDIGVGAQQSQLQPQDNTAQLNRSLASLVKTLQNAVNKAEHASESSSSSWNSRMGPEKGVRYRTGAPPPPPAWKYNKDDLRSFPKWQRKLSVWKRQIAGYMSKKDAALLLYSSLTGEAEEELEHCDLDRLESADGIEYIEQTLQSGLATRLVYQKRKLMADYESIVRQPGESMRAYSNRYRRCEIALQSVAVDVSGMYDSESRGNRLLERSRISPENQRLVLIGSGYKLTYESIVESLCMSFPEHKPPLQLFGKDGQPIKAKFSPSTSSSSTSSSASTSATSYRSFGSNSFRDRDRKGKGKGKVRQAFVAEAAEEPLEAIDEDDEEFHDPEFEDQPDSVEFEEPDDNIEQDDDVELLEDDPFDPQAIAQVLTVTAKKLQGLTLGRKFTGAKSVEERKKNSTCSACGQPGHWHGDSVCPKSGKAGKGSKGSGKSFDKDSAKGASKSKKVYIGVHHPDGTSTSHDTSVEPPCQEPPPITNYFTFVAVVAHEVFTVDSSLQGMMVIDTACQRTCAGLQWLDGYTSLLQQHRLCCKRITAPEAFQFGRGDPIEARHRVYLPACFDDHLLLIGASAVDTGIPLLASNTFLETMQSIIDVANSCIHFGAIDVTLPLVKINGHLTVAIAQFPKDVHKHSVWQRLSSEEFWHDPHPEILSDEFDIRDLSRPKRTAGVLTATDVATSTSQMDASLAPLGSGTSQPGMDHTPLDVIHGEARLQTLQQGLDDAAREIPAAGGRSADGSHQVGAREHAQGVLSSRVEAPREQVRFLRDVHPVPHQGQVEHGRANLGGFSWMVGLAKIFLAAAILFKYLATGIGLRQDGHASHSAQIQEQGQANSVSGNSAIPATSSTEFSLFSPGFEDAFDTLGGIRPAVGQSGPNGDPLGRGDGYESHGCEQPGRGVVLGRQDLSLSVGPSISIDSAGSGMGRSRGKNSGVDRSGSPSSTLSLKPGFKKQLIGKIKKAKHAAETELNLYEALATKHRTMQSRTDILEVFAGRGLISSQAPRHGLSACTPVDYNTGFDLATAADQARVRQIQKKLRPLFLIAQLHCTPWLLMQDNMNYVNRPEELEARRALERPVVEEAMQWCRTQHAAGHFYLLENPLTSRLWQEEAVQSMLHDTGAFFVTCHSGAYGAKNTKGQMIKKTFQFASNNKDILHYLSDKLTAEELKQCVPLEGKDVTQSQEYPQRLITSILQGVRYVAKLHNPTRFSIKKVYAAFSQPDTDQEKWQDVIARARLLFTSSSTSNIILEQQDQLHKQIQALLPWEITRLQLAWRPLVQRMPQHVPHTHRGQVLKYIGREKLHISSEDLSDVHFPRGRFEAPVDIAVFFFGYPQTADEDIGIPGEEAHLHDQDPEQQLQRENPTKEVFHDEIFFPNASNIDRSIKAAVARMHKNMGHLPPAEILKLLALNGITSDQVIKATKAMVCSACQRAKPPKPPNPASSHPQYLGQFADNVQADIFYLRDMSSKNYPILGMICEATHLHAAIRLESRQPIHVAKALREAWVRNFGFPLRLSVDDDGAFKSDFMNFCDEGGTFVDFIPPEAHYKLGTIERHNGTLRMLLERIVDSTPCTSPEDLDNAIVSALYAKNSATWSSGRPPYIAAFGKIPRIGLDFINDPRALVAGSTRSDMQQQAAMMRCEAYKAIAEATASSTLRRALLRKTNVQPIMDPTPGSLLAYWRWTVRSHRKRGGYRIARYLGKDPDNNLWVQSGNQTLKVAPNQVRDVFGYEEYVPSRQDIKSLQQAEQNLRDDLWSDDRIPLEAQPPEEPEDGLDDAPPEAAALEMADQEFPSMDLPLVIQPQEPQPEAKELKLPKTKPSGAVPPEDPQELMSPSTVIHMKQKITQNIFGKGSASTATPLPAPFTPSRRSRPARSRTPTSVRRLEREGTFTDPYMLASAGQEALADQIAPDTPALEPSEQHPGGVTGVPNSGARWLTPRNPVTPPLQGLPEQEPVDLTGEDDDLPQPGEPDLTRVAPVTPDDLGDEPLPTLPAKRPFHALKTDITARKAGQGSLNSSATRAPLHDPSA